ncbi:MAG: non-canonical purine NTP pyrophosphatase [Bryobacterales bacterium]|nr:non-canonical purine NTP pyrophosphatase [Bryobacterales bacterium]
MPIELFCATSNKGKLLEFRQASGADVVIQGLPSVDCAEVGRSFEDNAVAKAICYAQSLSGKLDKFSEQAPLVFADDSGLEVDALNGAPGILSARFAGSDADHAANNRLLIEKLHDVPLPRRTARFVCCIALTRAGRIIKTFQADVKGMILKEARGEGGFGYDPLFYVPALEATFAELLPDEKWMYSHRGQAFRKMLDWLRESL